MNLRLHFMHEFKRGNNGYGTKAPQVEEQYENGFKKLVVEVRASTMKREEAGHTFFRMKI